jgi:hypothetical protein
MIQGSYASLSSKERVPHQTPAILHLAGEVKHGKSRYPLGIVFYQV